jgi:tRNA uridine 5-carboxymethylaminomethyl modification enzyme
VTLITLHADALVRLSCNPAIGGIGKSHLVREIDALGGLMARAADRAGIHFRLLNRSRGPAVRGARVQQDHDRYPELVTRVIRDDSRIDIVEGEVTALAVEQGAVVGCWVSRDRFIPADAVVLTTGTFLRGRMFRGDLSEPGGRTGERAADTLSGGLEALGLRLERFKTGTPPRIESDSIDFARFEPQPGDDAPEPLSFENLRLQRFKPSLPQRVTHLAYTREKTHELVRQGLQRSPLYSGRIRSRGPRYCPSFEDKVVKFPDRPAHLLHLEPMGLDHPWVYVNGLSMSLPPELQERVVRSILGLEEARIARHGYAVEYDFVPPTQLEPTLETRPVRGLFLAGQICGTTGYEEAAALGVVAGANAAMRATDRDRWVPDRLTSYIGVMVDDLTTRGVLEPYRMFTSRAELRLSLSPDTADRRMLGTARRLGLTDEASERATTERWERIARALAALEGNGELRSPRRRSPGDQLRRGADGYEVVTTHFPEASAWSESDRTTLISLVRYRGYLERERREADRLREVERVAIPSDLDFDRVPGLRQEFRERLSQTRPTSLGQASRIPGMTPAALGLLAAAIAQNRRVSRRAALER